MKVLVGWLDPGTVAGGFAVSLANLVAYSVSKGLLGGVQRISSGPNLDVGRNTLWRVFVESDADSLLMIDADMTFGHDALERLATRRVPVAAGLCFGYTDKSGPYPTIGHFTDGGVVEWALDYPSDGATVACDVTGAAFILIDKTVADLVGGDPFNRVRAANGVLYGEDVSFCRRLHDAGVEVTVDTHVATGHVKQFTWDQESHAKYREEHRGLHIVGR